MPRLTPELIRAARRRHAFLPLLLPECRTIEQASMELRWLAHEGRRGAEEGGGGGGGGRGWLKALCERRGRGWPLQYLLGTQPFGALEMICERGVLIPRFVIVLIFLPLRTALLCSACSGIARFLIPVFILDRKRSSLLVTLVVIFLNTCTRARMSELLIYALGRDVFLYFYIICYLRQGCPHEYLVSIFRLRHSD